MPLLLLQLTVIIGSIICHCNSFHLTHPLPSSSHHFVNHHNKHNKECKNRPTTLKAVSFSSDINRHTITATSTILISSLVGYTSDKLNNLKTKDGKDGDSNSSSTGLIITLIIAITLSNLVLPLLLGYADAVPIHHPIYDLCWNKFLPGSLALILISTSSSSSSSSSSGSTTYIQENANGEDNNNDMVFKLSNRSSSLSTKELIVAIGIPFLIGSFGSLTGCIFSSTIQVYAKSIHIKSLEKISMGPVEASIAAGKFSKCFYLYYL